jgi:hypothetical protein
MGFLILLLSLLFFLSFCSLERGIKFLKENPQLGDESFLYLDLHGGIYQVQQTILT